MVIYLYSYTFFMKSSFLLNILFLLISFLFTLVFTQWSEGYINWYTWREDYFNNTQHILFYLIPFLMYVLVRHFVKIYKVIFCINVIYIYILYYYISEFLVDFKNLNISLIDFTFTWIAYLYMLICLYFIIDFWYCAYKIFQPTFSRIFSKKSCK